jgi:hypothetical protein
MATAYPSLACSYLNPPIHLQKEHHVDNDKQTSDPAQLG